jgi:hypothetical protein
MYRWVEYGRYVFESGERSVLIFLRVLVRFVVAAAIVCTTILFSQARAQTPPEVARGLQWLSGQVRTDGSLLNELQSVATPLQNRSEAAQTLKLLASIPSALADKIAAETDDNSEYEARQIMALSLAGRSVAARLADLISRQNSDGGFGIASGFASNPLDTAWAMLALNAANGNNSAVIPAAVSYLLASQEVSGGFAVTGNDADSYITALAAAALLASSNSPATVDALTRINSWLLSRQQTDGSWGSVGDTSLVFLALLGSTSDAGLRNRVTVFLASQQGSDGSWGGDPYETALALRALIAQPRPVQTTGNVVVQVVDNTAGQPIAGASGALQGPQNATAASDAGGKISFSDVTAGSYTLTVAATGYSSQLRSFALQAGTTADLGVVRLTPAPTTGVLQGVVKDAVTGTTLAGVSISVTGSANATTLTLADGSYRITGLAPGAVTVAAGKTGYVSAGGTGTIVAGAVLLFSPALQPEGQPPATVGSVVGQVVDAVNQAPLSGVTITVGTAGRTALSGIDGRFRVTDLAGGTYAVSFALIGYTPKSLPAVLVSVGSDTDVQVVGLSKAINTVTVTGKVTDLNTGQPIPGATITVLGAGQSVATDSTGSYRIDGLTPGTATLRFGAVGYTSETVILSFEFPGEFNVNHALRAGEGSNLSLALLASDQSHYGAYAPATIRIEAQNTGAQAAAGTVGLTILDPLGKVLESLQATWVDANGVVQHRFDFPPGTTIITVPWNTNAHAPGIYTIIAKIYQGSDSSPPGGLLEIAEKQATFAIDPTQAIASEVLTPLPGFSNLGATEQIGFKLDIVNRSNVPVTTVLSYQLLAPNSALILGATVSVRLEPEEGTKSVLIDGLTYTFASSGLYQSGVTLMSGPVPASLVGNVISVAPGTRIDPSQNLTPAIVTPDGDKRIRVDIRLQGVEQK